LGIPANNFKRLTPQLRGSGGRNSGKTGQSTTRVPLSAGLGLGQGRRFADHPTKNLNRAHWPEPMAKPGRGGEARPACTTPAWNPGKFEQTDTPRTTQPKPKKTAWCKRMPYLPAQPKPDVADGTDTRRAPALSSMRPTTPFSRPRGRSQNEHTKRPRGSAGTAG